MRVIVALHPPAAVASGDPQAEARAVDAAQDALARTLPGRGARELGRTQSLPIMVLEIDRAELAGLAADPRVAAIEEDRVARPMLAESTGTIGAPAVWADGYAGAGQAVVVLDTGVDLSHPFVQDAVVDGACFSTSVSYPATTTTPDYSSSSLCPDGSREQIGRAAGAACPPTIFGCDHGTHVAGIVAGRRAPEGFNGVARAAQVISVQVYSRFTGSICGSLPPSGCALSWTSDQVRALDWVYSSLRQRLDVAAVNISLGASALAAPCDSEYPATQTAIQRLREAGIPTIVASGNSGASDLTNAKLSAPACVSSAIAVGSTTRSDTVSSFSNSAPQLALLAPGDPVRSSLPGGLYGVRQGTSLAAPHVAGAWAVVRAARPDASLDQILAALQSSGKPVTDSRNGLTRPRLQLDAALASLPGPVAALHVSAQAVDFGQTEIGSTSAPRLLTLSNLGASPLTIGAITISGDFARVGGTCPTKQAMLAPSGSCTVEIVFTPSTPGAQHGLLAVTSEGLPLPSDVELVGAGLLPVVPSVFLPAISR
ncbi:MAG: hypothetical protein RLZZ387_3794 [Chloroflexota bacterium]